MKLSDIAKDLVGSPLLAPTLQTNFFSSRTWTAPQDGYIVVRAMGAGGGGATHTGNSTGGYSGSWGAKALRVAKGDTVVVNIGAGGAGAPGDGAGNAGGNTTVTVKGVTYTAYGGPGGLANLASASAVPDGPSPSANWDFGAASVKPGWVGVGGCTGGAGVDILAQGNNATTSSSAGGGTGGAANGVISGGAVGTKSADGRSANSPPIYLDASNGEWGISFYGGSGTTSGKGANGAGGSGGAGVGGNGGGGGGGATGDLRVGGAAGGLGGGGGGGGGGGTTGGNGGNGYAHLKFYADMKI